MGVEAINWLYIVYTIVVEQHDGERNEVDWA